MGEKRCKSGVRDAKAAAAASEPWRSQMTAPERAAAESQLRRRDLDQFP